MVGIRRTLDLAHVEMAKKLGISKSALCEVEKGRTFVSVDTAVKYAKKCGFSQTVAVQACFQNQLLPSFLQIEKKLA
jgi:DNA-binding XRE family transcriptional regulator